MSTLNDELKQAFDIAGYLRSVHKFLNSLKWSQEFMESEQGKQAAALIENGDTLAAQRIILNELEKHDGQHSS